MERPTAVSVRERPHPGPREYVKIAVALAIVTLLEVGVYYVDFLRPALVPLLLVFSTIKFALVVLWFMHLRFDSRLFMRLFVAGVVLALSIFAVAFWLFFGG
ncbi:MAG TPA: cytochrome C oxidase subunit IV family protein [Actinomycetota bacterium]|jgi:cytochrome c oxidase subunit 4|nr:cytochrome C oxidase subunit IV family protein [Actinomycetota bacterium]